MIRKVIFCRILSLFVIFISINETLGKEYKSFKEFQHITGLSNLKQSDWLKSDRKRNTLVWQNANKYNLNNNLSAEYETIVERRDFYAWLINSLAERQKAVIWPKIAHYISKKLCLTIAFPFNLITTRTFKDYACQGSKQVFESAFKELLELYNASGSLENDNALEWDTKILYLEQFSWLQNTYEDIDNKTLKTIQRMAEGKGIYALLVPRAVRFKGDISFPEMRFEYALQSLRPYCEQHNE